MPRQARIDSPGLYQHVICRGIERRLLFRKNSDYARFKRILAEVVAESAGAKLFAWALMPNHVHLFVQVDAIPLKTMMTRLLTKYAIYFNTKYKRIGHLFHNRYRSLICDQEEYFLELIRYIHLNPLKAGIVKSFTELQSYRYSGHFELINKTHSIWQEKAEVLGKFSNRSEDSLRLYMEFLQDGIDRIPQKAWEEVMNIQMLLQIIDENDDKCSEKITQLMVRELEPKKKTMRSQESRGFGKNGIDVEKVMNQAAAIYGVERNAMHERSMGRASSKVRALAFFLAVRRDGFSISDVARAFRMNRSSVSRAIPRGGYEYKMRELCGNAPKCN